MPGDSNLKLRIILEAPPPDVDFALQEGKGNNYTIVQNQKSSSGNLSFDFVVKLKSKQDAEPDFSGPFVQGPADARFVYIGVGTFAGQALSPWSRRLKIPLSGISPEMARKAVEDGKLIFETRVPGTGKDGTPNCATVKPFAGWQLVKTDS